MKKLLLAGTAIAAFSSAAFAETQFVKGTVSFGVTPIDGGDIIGFDTDASVAFTTGNWGFQIGGDMTTYTDFNNTLTTSGVDLHFYRNLNSGNKVGVYTSTINFGGPSALETGVEGMVSFGAFDIEASTGILSGNYFGDTGTYDLTAYYNVSQQIEVSAGLTGVYNLSGPGSETGWNVGAAYAFGGSGLEATIDYESIEGYDNISVGLSWSFGPNQDERLFKHGSGFFNGLFIG